MHWAPQIPLFHSLVAVQCSTMLHNQPAPLKRYIGYLHFYVTLHPRQHLIEEMGDQISQSDQLISSMLQHSSHLECVTLVFSSRQCCVKQNNFLIRQSQGNRIEKSLNRYICLIAERKRYRSTSCVHNRGKGTLYERRNLTSGMICSCFLHILHAPHTFVCTKSCQCNKTFSCEYSAHALLCLLFFFFLQCLYPTMINYQLAQFAVQFASAPKMVGVRKIKHCALNAGRLWMHSLFPKHDHTGLHTQT